MKVLVAMSGGVDSSVAAALLLEQGHEVVGVTMRLWGGESDTGCCSVSDVDDARRVAQQIGIPRISHALIRLRGQQKTIKELLCQFGLFKMFTAGDLRQSISVPSDSQTRTETPGFDAIDPTRPVAYGHPLATPDDAACAGTAARTSAR